MSEPDGRPAAAPGGGIGSFVAAVLVAGQAAALAATRVADTGPVPWPPALILGAVALLSLWVPLRFQHRGEVTGFTLEAGVLVAILFVLPRGLAPLLLGTAALVGHSLRRAGWQKPLFNTGQILLASSAATLVFHAVGPDAVVLAPRSLVAGVLSTLTFDGVNLLVTAELFRRLDGRPPRQTIRQTWRLWAVTWVGNTSFGLLLAFVVLEDPAAAVLASTLMVGLYLGYRGYARVLEERRRNERLHEVSRVLVEAPATPDAFERFLSALALLFGGEDAILVLLRDGGHDRYAVGPSGFRLTHATGPLPDPLTRAVEAGNGLLVGADDPAPPVRSYRDALVAPLIFNGRTLGTLAVHNRHGLEPWEPTDARLLASLANEAAVAIENVELFEAIERERARLAEESRKLSGIVEAASDGIVMVAADGRIAAWNPAMASITGVGTAEAIGQPWHAVMPLRGVDGTALAGEGDGPLRRALRGERHDGPIEVQAHHRDGSWRWLRCTVAPIRGGGGATGSVIVARDATREHEVAQLKADFVATVSHELRTPLTPLRGFLETLTESAELLTREQARVAYAAMGRQLDRLERLVADLLVVVDLDRGALALSTHAVDLAEVVHCAVDLAVAGRAGGAGRAGAAARVTLDIPGDGVTVVADRAAAVRVVCALVSNALEHTAGPVRVAVSRHGGRAVVSVADAGPGVPHADQERIFERFARLGDHLLRPQGAGLGLPIARSLARALGGDVTLTSSPGRGSVFRLALPVVRVPAGSASGTGS